MNRLTILILLIAWATPLLAALMHKRGNQLKKKVEAIGSFLILFLLIIFLIWPGGKSTESQVGFRGLSAILIYPVMTSYALLGFRAAIKPKYGKGNSGSWSILVLFILAGILGVILGEYLSIILVSWVLIIFYFYKLITYKDLDLAARQDYRERLDKDYLDRF
jgi:NADH:ubiquinone oxidoreductase subunit 2 (subunit N)